LQFEEYAPARVVTAQATRTDANRIEAMLNKPVPGHRLLGNLRRYQIGHVNPKTLIVNGYQRVEKACRVAQKFSANRRTVINYRPSFCNSSRLAGLVEFGYGIARFVTLDKIVDETRTSPKTQHPRKPMQRELKHWREHSSACRRGMQNERSHNRRGLVPRFRRCVNRVMERNTKA